MKSIRSLAFGAMLFAIFAAALCLSPAAALGVAAVLPLLGITADPEVAKLLGEAAAEIKSLKADVAATKGEFGLIKETKGQVEKLELSLDGFQKQFKQLRSAQLAERKHLVRQTGQISDEAAAQVLAASLATRIKAGGNLEAKQRDHYAGIYKEITGVEVKAALTSSDIPLPVEHSGEIVELVSAFGAARRYGTVYPLGSASVKLPRLGTDPTFGLIAASGSVTEKSPTIVNVTFTPEKFGGLIRLPSEIDADSIVPMGQFLARYAARQIAYVEDYQFFRSSGAGSGLNGSVEGLCTSTITNSKVTQMASTKVKYSDATLANLRTVRSVVDAAALGMSAYYLHPTFEQHLAGLNTAGDKPYQANGINGATLDGFPIRWVDSMPAYSTGSNASKVFVLFGDLSFQYLGIRGGMRFESSQEAAFATDEILVRALERLTIGLMATGAVAGLQTAAS